MLESVLGAAGILVSILLFLVGYRQTVGARESAFGLPMPMSRRS